MVILDLFYRYVNLFSLSFWRLQSTDLSRTLIQPDNQTKMDDNSNNRESVKSTEVQWIQACRMFVYKWAVALCLYVCFCDVVNRSPAHLWRRQRRVTHRRAVLHTPGRKKVSKPPIREVKLSSGNLLIIFHHRPSRTELSEKKDVCAIYNVLFTTLNNSFLPSQKW